MMPNNPIVGSTILRRPAIQSPNFVHGSAGWNLGADGSFEAENATIRGTITAGVFQGTDFIINNSGVFFYSGTPAANNLIASIAPASGTDSFGNFYRAGITSQENSFGTGATLFGSTLQFLNASGTPLQVSFSPSGLFVYAPGGGAGNLFISLAMTSGTDQYGNAYPAGLGLFQNTSVISFPQAGLTTVGIKGVTTGAPYVMIGTPVPGTGLFVDASGKIYAPNPATPGIPETWHNLTLTNSWGMQTSAYARYKLDANNRVWLDAKLTAGTLANGTPIATLPTGYIPASHQPVEVMLENPGTMTAQALTPRVEVQPATGQIQVFNLPTSLTQCSINGSYPLD